MFTHVVFGDEVSDLLDLIGFCPGTIRLQINDFIYIWLRKNMVIPFDSFGETQTDDQFTQGHKINIGIGTAAENTSLNYLPRNSADRGKWLMIQAAVNTSVYTPARRPCRASLNNQPLTPLSIPGVSSYYVD